MTKGGIGVSTHSVAYRFWDSPWGECAKSGFFVTKSHKKKGRVFAEVQVGDFDARKNYGKTWKAV